MNFSVRSFSVISLVIIMVGLIVYFLNPDRGMQNAYNWAIGVGYECFEYYEQHGDWPESLEALADPDGRIEWSNGYYVTIGDGRVALSEDNSEVRAFDGKNRATYYLSEENRIKWKSHQLADRQK